MPGLRRGATFWALAVVLAIQSSVLPAHASPTAPEPDSGASAVAGAPAPATPQPTPAATPAGSATPATPAGSPAAVEPSPSASPQPTADPAPEPSPSTSPATSQPATTTRNYIVEFRDTSTGTERSDAVRGLGRRLGRRLTVFPGVLARLTDAERDRLAADPAVAAVVADTPVRAADTQWDPPWGLDRLDQADLPLSGSFSPRRTGAGVTVYVLDTGITPTLADFGGRVAPGRSFISDGLGTADCKGHGTHVAGTLAGEVYGVAKAATLVPVRMLDCEGNGTASGVVAALDWVASEHRAGTPAVANLSFTGPFNKAENDAVRRLVDDGVTVVIAAGNDGIDACGASPASAPRGLTVAASDSIDQRASFSNLGPCVDVYAPGVNVPSDSATGASVAMESGTSMATPHVAGIAALLLQEHPGWSPAKVSSRLLRLALPGKVTGNPSGTPNLLANIAPRTGAVSPAASLTSGGRRVTISGLGLVGVQRVLFDGVPGTRLEVDSDTRLTVTTPAHAVGPVDVVVETELADSNDVPLAYQERPVVGSVSPRVGPTVGGTTVTIAGTGFEDVVAVRFGSRAAASFTVVSATEISAVTPPAAKGSVDVRVVLASSTSVTGRATGFRFGNLARISRLSVAAGLTIGGERLLLRGTSFTGTTAVLFGGVPGTAVKVKTSKKLYVTVPAHAAGTVDVQVVNRYGTSAPTTTARWAYSVAPPPAVTGLSPSTWYTVGANKVRITGTNFHAVSAVAFGSSPAEVLSASATALVVRAPTHPIGAVEVQVSGFYGTSAAGSASTYTYTDTPAPTVARVSPASGSHKGGTRVTITGSRFYAVSSVTFGDVAGTRLKVLSSSKLEVTTPAHAVGTVAVQVVESAYLASAPSTAARFRYT